MNKTIIRLLNILLAILLSSCTIGNKVVSNKKPDPIKIIFETDIGNDVDDALALDMLYKYIDSNKIDLLGIMINKEGEYPVNFIDIMNTWYGYPDIPIGIVRDGTNSEHDATNYAKCVALLENNISEPTFNSSNVDYSNVPNAHELYREILSEQPDGSVVIVSVGFSTNLVCLLDITADEFSTLNGKELVAKKVKYLSNMAGCFNDPDMHEYNVVKDIAAAQKVFEEWPTNIITSPF